MYIPFAVFEWCRRFSRKTWVSFMRWNVRFFSKKIRDRIEGYETLPDWKQTALKDFKFWLEDMPGTSPEKVAPLTEACDLYTLLSEFSALRQEIRMQNREQNKSVQTLGSFIGSYQETWEVFKERSENLDILEERIRQAAEKRAVMPFLDVRDALLRGYHSSRELADVAREMASKSKGFFRSAPKEIDEVAEGIEGIVEGYVMAVSRFDRALQLANIHPLETLGQPFDPKTMKAVGKTANPDAEGGIVMEEQLGGFIRDDEVIRTAEVVVSC
ncbi:nucleotide exchange factor GrpE [Desulfococcaceae bacterium HSG8]|nr:nucleotide exchange factor GrpE [Desulfococcaceae bacterium HSG8]